MAGKNKKKRNLGTKGVSVERRSIARNRRAKHDFLFLEELECGIVLVGTEVKSLRGGQCTLQEAFVRVTDGEMWLMRAHIPEYKYGNALNHQPLRQRKLLAHRTEIARWEKKGNEKGVTMIPTEVYFQGSNIKVHVALATGKKVHDKRAALKEQEAKRDIDRAMSRRDR